MNDKKGWTEILNNSVGHKIIRWNLVVLNIILVLLASIIWSCTSHESGELPERYQELTNLTMFPADQLPENTIQIQRETSYGRTNNVFIDIIGSFAVDDSGRVYMTAGRSDGIHIFEPGGEYLTRIGREGRGPGEFSTAPAIFNKSNRLYAIEYMAYRISIFSVDSLKLIRSINIDMSNKNKLLADYKSYHLIPGKDGTFLVRFTKFLRELSDLPAGTKIDTIFQRYYPMDRDGILIPNQVLKVKDQSVVTASFFDMIGPIFFQFFDKPLVAVSNDGSIYAANSKDFMIKEYSYDGHYLRAFFHPYQNVSLTTESALEDYPSKRNQVRPGISESMLENIIDARQRVIRQMDLPQNWPALNDLLLDDENRLWVSTIVEDFDVYEWWIIEENGELITKFGWPRDEPIEVVKNNFMYTRETDEETGLQQVVRYRIEISDLNQDQTP